MDWVAPPPWNTQNRNNRYKRIGIHNIFTLDIYNRNWLLDVVTVNPLNEKDEILSS